MFRPIKTVSLTETRDPDIIRRTNILAESQGLPPTTALRRFLDKHLPKDKRTAAKHK